MKIIYILLIVLLSSNLFAKGVATITALRGEGTVLRESNSLKASIGIALEQKDRVKTAHDTKLQMVFADETIVTLGRDSDFSIEEYLFDDAKEPSIKFGMIQGAMRTITGKIGKIAPQKFAVQTKTATIGIRGTNFSIIIQKDGTFEAYCTYGAIEVVFDGHTVVVQQGYFIHISPDGKYSVKGFSPQMLHKMKIQYFSFSKSKSSRVSKKGYAQKGENEEQLDVTITDDSATIASNVDEQNANAAQSPISLSDLLASYAMSNALYTGTYNVTSSLGFTGLSSNGIANLSVDFGADTTSLTLDPTGQTPAQFSGNLSPGATTFTLTQTTGNTLTPGSADGTFSAPTGNAVNGNFNFTQNSSDYSKGTYSVSTSQVLH